ncbi:DUF3108 domain-containing protein [Allorhizobium sp. BGMRC 0089]|uniref:DUF3108 domain-containing protein n=1 Tax=Allorhizobium sonneratiae TaxID=2934936 RepID=UPI002033BC38|nr:DUF3108 domain-containing protein [Allorhizobium sonneratiae]MCM2293491.1 DUF3108 domain-containing protein [Allorhizobium sonneratiae]
MRVFRFHLTACLLAMTIGQTSSPVWAATRTTTEYRVTILGIPVARAAFATDIDTPSYSITGTISSAGITTLFVSLLATTTVKGQIVGDRLSPSTYRLVYTRGKKTRIYDVGYSHGDVTRTTIAPEPHRDPDRWIPVSPADLKSVLDPLGGLILPGNANLCHQTLPIYDGESRLDLVLSPKGKASFSAGKTSGEAIVCGVRYVPKSGYSRGRDDIEYLRKATSMEIWFAPTGTMNLYAPVYARIPTRIGPLSITATKFGP